MTILEALHAAVEAGVKEHCRKLSEQQWQDVGTCGYGTITLGRRSLLARTATEHGLARQIGGDVVFDFKLPPGIRAVQSANVNQAAADAIVASLRESGFADVKIRHWID